MPLAPLPLNRPNQFRPRLDFESIAAKARRHIKLVTSLESRAGSCCVVLRNNGRYQQWWEPSSCIGAAAALYAGIMGGQSSDKVHVWAKENSISSLSDAKKMVLFYVSKSFLKLHSLNVLHAASCSCCIILFLFSHLNIWCLFQARIKCGASRLNVTLRSQVSSFFFFKYKNLTNRTLKTSHIILFQNRFQSGGLGGRRAAHAAPPTERFKGYISALELDFPGKLNAMPHVGREDRPAAVTPSDIKRLKDQREYSLCAAVWE